jgi:hypothetical protein
MPDYQIGSTRLWGHASRGEFLADLKTVTDAQERIASRTLKWWSETGINMVAGGLFIPLPDQGYDWNLKLISMQLSGSTTAQAFIASSAPSAGSTPPRLISIFGATTASALVEKFSSSQVYVRRGEGVWLLPAADTINAWFVTAEQAMSEMAYKAYD